MNFLERLLKNDSSNFKLRSLGFRLGSKNQWIIKDPPKSIRESRDRRFYYVQMTYSRIYKIDVSNDKIVSKTEKSKLFNN